MYKGAHRRGDNLYGAISDFAREHDDVYFEIGVLIGIKLSRDMQQTSSQCIQDFFKGTEIKLY